MEKTEEILEILTKVKYIESTFIELDERQQTVYKFKSNYLFVMLLILMKAYIEPPTHFFSEFNTRDKPFLTPRKEESQ